MENKINIAELLRDCPRGTELDCVIFNNVTLECVSDEGIWIKYIDSSSKSRVIHLTSYGGMDLQYIETKCVIFPRGKTTWEGFTPPYRFKDGDILYIKAAFDWVCIYKETKDTENIYKYAAIEVSSADNIVYNNHLLCCKKDIIKIRIATKEEKQKLFNAIKANGYHWNSETKVLEKLPKFKVGDKIKEKTNRWPGTRTIRSYDKNIGYFTTINDWVRIEDQDNWELVIEKPIFKEGDKIRDTRNNSEGVIQELTNEGYECHFEYGNSLISYKEQHYFILVLDKFDITTLKPFESRVLVRDNDFDRWKPSFWGYLRESEIQYDTVRGAFRQCIPYEGNEHLMKTTNDCDEYYKTWKK